jgi:hypothetical protein
MFIFKKNEVGGKREKIAPFFFLHKVISSLAAALAWRYIGDGYKFPCVTGLSTR